MSKDIKELLKETMALMTFGHKFLVKTSSIAVVNRHLNILEKHGLYRDTNKDAPTDELSEKAKCLNRLLNHYLQTIFEKKSGSLSLSIWALHPTSTPNDEGIVPSGPYVSAHSHFNLNGQVGTDVCNLTKYTFKSPSEIFYRLKEAQFDETGRPFSYLFYTMKPNFYDVMHKLGYALENADSRLSDNSMDPTQDQIEQFQKFKATFCRLLNHKHAPSFKDLLMSFQMPKADPSCRPDIPAPLTDENGRLYQISTGTRRLSSAEVTVWSNGTGKITIDHPSFTTTDILHFTRLKHRQALITPLLVTGTLGLVDVHIQFGGVIGFSNEAFAARSGLAWSLASLVDEENVERLRLAGLLTKDIQLPERKMYGRAGARKRYKWRKR